MEKKSSNKNLHKAGQAKKDEFYTQLVDIEKELKHYKEQFHGKIVYCNCDDPFESNFFRYFAANFNVLKLKKLIATSYSGSPIIGGQLSLLEIKGSKGKQPIKIEISEVPDTNKDGAIDLRDNSALYEVNLKTGSEKLLVSDLHSNSYPAFSPDGESIVFLSRRRDTNQDGKIDHTDYPALYLKDLSTGKEELLIEARHRPKFPSFSPDGESILSCSWSF